MVKLAKLRLSVGSTTNCCCICVFKKSNWANILICFCNVSSNAAVACCSFWTARVFASFACSTARRALVTASCILADCTPAIGIGTGSGSKEFVGNLWIGDITGEGVESGCP